MWTDIDWYIIHGTTPSVLLSQMLKLISDGAEPRIIIESLLDHIEKGNFAAELPGGSRSSVSAGGIGVVGVGTSTGGEYFRLLQMKERVKGPLFDLNVCMSYIHFTLLVIRQ